MENYDNGILVFNEGEYVVHYCFDGARGAQIQRMNIASFKEKSFLSRNFYVEIDLEYEKGFFIQDKPIIGSEYFYFYFDGFKNGRMLVRNLETKEVKFLDGLQYLEKFVEIYKNQKLEKTGVGCGNQI